MSPSPEPIVSIASRTAHRRLKAREVIRLAMASAASVSTTSAISVALNTCVSPTVASALSSATTRYQSVPGMRLALTSFSAPASVITAGSPPSRARPLSASGLSSGATSVAGLSANLSSTWEIT